jgi:hypothetical protein
MSIKVQYDEYDELDEDARAALLDTGAIRECDLHKVTIRLGDKGAEHRAHTLATNALTEDGAACSDDDLVSCIRGVLERAADGECPDCATNTSNSRDA